MNMWLWGQTRQLRPVHCHFLVAAFRIFEFRLSCGWPAIGWDIANCKTDKWLGSGQVLEKQVVAVRQGKQLRSLPLKLWNGIWFEHYLTWLDWTNNWLDIIVPPISVSISLSLSLHIFLIDMCWIWVTWLGCQRLGWHNSTVTLCQWQGPRIFRPFASVSASLVLYHGCEQLGQDAGPDCECPAGVREDTSTYYFELSVWNTNQEKWTSPSPPSDPSHSWHWACHGAWSLAAASGCCRSWKHTGHWWNQPCQQFRLFQTPFGSHAEVGEQHAINTKLACGGGWARALFTICKDSGTTGTTYFHTFTSPKASTCHDGTNMEAIYQEVSVQDQDNGFTSAKSFKTSREICFFHGYGQSEESHWFFCGTELLRDDW